MTVLPWNDSVAQTNINDEIIETAAHETLWNWQDHLPFFYTAKVYKCSELLEP